MLVILDLSVYLLVKAVHDKIQSWWLSVHVSYTHTLAIANAN